MTHWLIGQLHLQSPVLWLLLSLITTMGLAVAYWRTQSQWVDWLWLGQWILIPYIGLLAGGLSPRLMGLAYHDWPATLGFGSALLFVTTALLVIVRVAAETSERPLTQPGAHPSERPDHQIDGAAIPPLWQTMLVVTLLGGAEEFHWAFLRGAVWEVLLVSPSELELPAYWAMWIASLFVILETALRRPSFEKWLVQITVLAATSILFLYTRNFWICWILHSAALFILTANSRSQPTLPGLNASHQ